MELWGGQRKRSEKEVEKEMATHSSTLAWRIPGMEDPGRLPSLGSHRLGHDWSDLAAAAAAEKEGVYVCIRIADSLCFTAETNTALESNYTLIFLQLLWPPLPHHPPAPTATNNLKFWKIPIRALMKNNFTWWNLLNFNSSPVSTWTKITARRTTNLEVNG